MSAARAILWSLVLLPALAGCDESFQPIAPAPVAFSIWGQLDAAADTQWIRISPIRPVVTGSPGPLDIQAYLEHTGTGEVIRMWDSVFDYPQPAGVQYAHNFWTAEPIEPGATYRFTAERPGEEPAQALVELPPAYELELWIWTRGYADYLWIPGGLEHVAFAETRATYFDDCGVGEAADPIDLGEIIERDGGMLIPIARGVSLTERCGTPVVQSLRLWLAGSGSEWPSGFEYGAGELGDVLTQATNLTNALGYLGGVLTREIPYDDCRFQGFGPGVPEYCKLRFDGGGAVFEGTVRDETCGGIAVPYATIELAELEGEPESGRRIRTTTADHAGHYGMSGVRPGRHLLNVVGTVIRDGQRTVLIHEVYQDTVELAAGEEVTHDVDLVRWANCGVGP